MTRHVVLSCLVLALVPRTLPAAGMQSAPWHGTWHLDAARSSMRIAQSAYKRVTLRIEPDGDRLKVIYDLVGVRGGRTHMEWVGRLDGRDYPVQGVDYVLTNAYRPVDERSYEILVKVDGRPVATSVAVVSPDGRSMTVNTRESDEAGRTVRTQAVYVRQFPK